MGSFVIYTPYNQKFGQQIYNDLLKWFKAHPERTDCTTDRGTVTKATLKQDVLRWCIKGVKLKEPKRLTKKFSKGSEDTYAKQKAKKAKKKKAK